jgi:hypothetical protein
MIQSKPLQATKRFGKKLARRNAASTFVSLFGFSYQLDSIHLATEITMNF